MAETAEAEAKTRSPPPHPRVAAAESTEEAQGRDLRVPLKGSCKGYYKGIYKGSFTVGFLVGNGGMGTTVLLGISMGTATGIHSPIRY